MDNNDVNNVNRSLMYKGGRMSIRKTDDVPDDNSACFSLISSSEETTGHDDKGTEATSQTSSGRNVFNMWVVGLPIIVFFNILVVAVVGFIFVSSRRGYKNMDQKFHVIEGVIREASILQAKCFHESFAELSGKVTAHAVTSESVWPFVTVPFFGLYAHHVKNITASDFVALSPMVANGSEHFWETYSRENLWWLDNEHEYTLEPHLNSHLQPDPINTSQTEVNISQYIFETSEQRSVADVRAPLWQMAPARSMPELINFDTLSIPEVTELVRIMETNHVSVLSKAVLWDSMYLGELRKEGQTLYNMLSSHITREHLRSPYSVFVYPIFKEISPTNSSHIVAFLQVVFSWEKYLSSLYHCGESLHFVLSNNCGQTFTLLHDGCETKFIGRGDRHQQFYRSPSGKIDNVFASTSGTTLTTGCKYSLTFYPTYEHYKAYKYNEPQTFASLLASSFALMVLFFYMYHRFVLRRTNKVLATAKRSNAVIESLFPTNVHERLFGSVGGGTSDGSVASSRNSFRSFPMSNAREAASSRLKNYLQENEMQSEFGDSDIQDRPIADLFPNATVLYADIVGFTAWSSMRDPSQVFTLLEALFGAFDSIAMRRGVFKVETIGDCYVAVTGLPDPRPDHAAAMAQFAWECMFVMRELTKKLEATLGPDTGDLSMRIGLHSGPVTAGVLRGERSRFQLFGDTVNTVARIESTGKRDRIHLSQDTAELLIEDGNFHWVKLRDDKITIKGKGELTTYWLTMGERTDIRGDVGRLSFNDTETSRGSYFEDEDKLDAEKLSRLLDFNVEIFQLLLKQIIARRNASTKFKLTIRDPAKASFSVPHGKTVLEEVKEIISLPKFDAKSARMQDDPESIELSDAVKMQLRDYVAAIASLYNENPFHSFEHASHVIMSVVKLLTRIVAPTSDMDAPDEEEKTNQRKLKSEFAFRMHDHTYGITSDPLTQFAVVFSALIHDVDHQGVPNTRLIVERPDLAALYKNKSVAEQNSVDLSWDLLMRPCYGDLRGVICANDTEWTHFRQLVVNTVMATDIVDKELKELRNARWEKAFSQQPRTDEDERTEINRKATIVIEHLIQASDVSHTMQHWHIYRKWNQKFFLENYKMYIEGRTDKDPSVFWYKGEIGFFDFYIIPLAKKLKDCGVFGVSSDEYLNYAVQNRDEWEQKGRAVVTEFIEDAEKLYKKSSS